MNILPKKRWHVRTKENIARVRKDEAEAAAKAKEEQKRIENADREARLSVLKLKAKQKLLDNCALDTSETVSTSAGEGGEGGEEEVKHEHVNLFSDLEHCTTGSNKEHDLEVKNKKEEYEKQIGYLTYLGQDTNESLGKKNWYEVLPEEARHSRSDAIKETYTKLVLRDMEGKPRPSAPDVRHGEVAWKAKQALDPIKAFKKHLDSKDKLKPAAINKELISNDKSEITQPERHKKHKKHHKKHKSRREEEAAEKLSKLQKLREKRLRREQEERRRARALLAAASGVAAPAPSSPPPSHRPYIKPKYNSQFNPELARQNYT